MKEQKCALTGTDIYSMDLQSLFTMSPTVLPGTESLNALFVIMVSYTTLSLYFTAKAVRQYLMFMRVYFSFHVPHYPLELVLQKDSDLLNYQLLEIIS